MTGNIIALSCWLLLGLVAAWLTKQLTIGRWLHQLFIACDQLVNVLITPFHRGAFADETLSSRCYRAHQAERLWGRLLMPPIDAVFSIWQGRNHCERAYIAERERLQAPPESR